MCTSQTNSNRGRKASDMKVLRFWSVTMTAACYGDQSRWSKMVEACRSYLSIHFLFSSLFQREWAERERERERGRESGADRAPVHATSFISDNIHGEIGLLWIWSEIFQRDAGAEHGLGLFWLVQAVRWNTPGSQPFPGLDHSLSPNATGPHWLICS